MLGLQAKVLFRTVLDPFEKAMIALDRFPHASVCLDSPFVPLLGEAIPD